MPANSHPDCGQVALITGITGQDGAYLADLLLAKGYVVHGVARQASRFDRARLRGKDALSRLQLHDFDIGEGADFTGLLARLRPDEIYHLAGQSHVPTSLQKPEETMALNAGATRHLLEAIALSPRADHVRLFHAASAQIFADAHGKLFDEQSPIRADNPYAASKLAAYEAVRQFRDMQGLHVSNGILFNHESPYRGPGFVTRKITMAAAAWANGARDVLRLGNLDTRRDWGHARDFVEAMWLMLQQPQPDDYVIATGVSHSVREFVELAFRETGRVLAWTGEGVHEVGRDAVSGEVVVRIDPVFFRPMDLKSTLGDASKARQKLGWQNHLGFEALVAEMVAADIDRLSLISGNAQTLNASV